MDARTRQLVHSPTKQGSGNELWETPPLVFEKLDEDFGPFDIDLMADKQRALCPVWFGPDSPYGRGGFDIFRVNALYDPQADGDWSAFMVENGYSNPVYGRMLRPVFKLAVANAQHCGFRSTWLVPLRVARWWKESVMTCASEVYLCDSRITFYENGAPRMTKDRAGVWRPNSAPFDSAIVRFLPGHSGPPVFRMWEVPEHVWV